GEALATLVVNKLKGTISVLAVKAPGFGDRRKEMLRDIATLTGGTVISEEIGRKLDSVTAEDFGKARRVVATKDDPTTVAGGGTTLLQAIPALDKVKLSGDAQVGVDIVRKALEAPARQIADNAGQSGEVVVAKVKTLKAGEGFDALAGVYGDMFKKGIVDAAKVTRSALQNAASIAAMVLTTETLITDVPERKDGS